MATCPLVTYLRVSTSRQGRSGLGIEAQRAALARFAETEGFEIAREFVEVEMRKGADALDRRPQLDRLSRDVHFISGGDCRSPTVGGCQLGKGRSPYSPTNYSASLQVV
jgi:hypothetical protein